MSVGVRGIPEEPNAILYLLKYLSRVATQTEAVESFATLVQETQTMAVETNRTRQSGRFGLENQTHLLYLNITYILTLFHTHGCIPHGKPTPYQLIKELPAIAEL